MKLQLDYNPKLLLEPINISNNILSIGSCFAENIAQKLQQFQFNIMVNPNGIVFNPSSIFMQLTSYLANNKLTVSQLVQFDGLWHSMQHHGSFSGANQQQVLDKINNSMSNAHQALLKADYLFITFGSAWVYKYEPTNEIVANNHKMDGKLFNKILLNTHYLNAEFENFYTKLKAVNPNIKILFSVSPVRYVRDGLYENNVSKAVLHQLVYNIINQHPTDCFYFSAYEIVMDELRDYRFYKADLVHPNELAIDYVWQKFINTCLTESSKQFIADFEKYILLTNHKPLHTDSLSYKKFEEQILNLRQSLMEKYPFLKIENHA
ncbi:MAG: GSCFA domain-containing protein [Bacteroidia bacterium]